MAESGGAADTDVAAPADEQRVEWLELFLDLVVVASVAVLTEGLAEHFSWGRLGLFLVIYAAIWFSWTSVVLYADLAGAQTRTFTVISGMAMVALMTAANPLHHGDHADAFAIGFIVVRVVTSRSALRTGKILSSWPLLQFGGATAPWVVSFFLDGHAKYWCWAVGIVVDLAIVFRSQPDSGETMLARLGRRQRADRDDRPARPGRDRNLTFVVAGVDRGHLEERLGLFLIIVFGEVASQVVIGAANHEWTQSFVRVAVVAFAVLVGLWWLTFTNGFVGAPYTTMATLPPRFGLPLHLLSTVGVVVMAAGLEQMLAHPEHDAPTAGKWLVGGGLAAHFLAMVIAGAFGAAPWRWVWGWGAPCVAAPLLAAAFAGGLGPAALLGICVAPLVWLLLFRHVFVRHRPARATAPSDG